MRIALLGVVVALTTNGVMSADEPKSQWITDYQKARQTAHRQGKPMFVVFR